MTDLPLPSLPTLKRPRSTSNPPSPTGSSSSKKAASEDLVSSPAPPALEAAARFEVSPLSNSILAEEGMTGTVEPEFEGSSGRTDVDVGSEWVKRTEEVHLDERQPEGVKGLRKEKYEELYNALLSSSPPPFKAWERYYLVPCKLRDDLKAAAFTDDATDVEVKIDMTPLLEDTTGEELSVIDIQAQNDGTTGLIAKGKKERVWDLKLGQVEDEDFVYISEAGWTTLASALNATNGPSLSRFCLPGDRIQLVMPIYTLYQVLPSAQTTNPPIRFTCPTETSIPIFVRLLRSLLAETTTVDKSSPCRVWQFESLLASENNDVGAQAALQTSILTPALVPALASKMVASSGETETPDTCARRHFEHGDAFILEMGTKLSGGDTDWVLDIGSSGEAFVKPTIRMPPVPTAPPPLFSQPAKYGGNAPSSSATQVEPTGSFGMTTRAQTKKVARTRGLVGLVNLGNTCFMNSATQCLSNTVELCDYFLSGVYREELNKDNPLGMYGQVAEAFGGVVENLWNSSSSSFSPRQFKQTTGRFAPQFAGYGQHDTQEFIAFLLDGLHEDLNRIQKKPYVEKPDWKAGGGNKELAELGKECWTGYKKRNDSVIVDLFQGQLMSTLVCPECHKESITMDPFMYLTVPLPIAQHREFKFQYVPRDPEKPQIRGKILVPANASFSQVKERLGSLLKCNPNHLIGFDLWKNSIYAWWIDSDHNGEAKDSDEAVFHDVGVSTSSTRKSVGTTATDGSITVPVFTFRTMEAFGRRAMEFSQECDLPPFFITLSKAEAADTSAVREAIAKGYARYMGEEAYASMWVVSGSKQASVPVPEEAPVEPSATLVEAVEGDAESDPQTKVAEIPVPSDGSELGSRPPSPFLDIRSSTIHHNASSASLSTLASTKSGKIVPRADLYKVHVANASSAEGGMGSLNPFKKSKDNVVPLHKGATPRSISNHLSSLEDRRKEKKNLLGRLTSGISSIVGGKEEAEPESANGTGTKDAASNLVVRPGEAIYCEWSPSAFRDHFETSREVVDFIDPAIEKERAKKKEGKSISIEDCLDEFSKEETLGQEDLWFCPVCKKHQAATKKLEIYKAPDILVICIKRFGSSRRLSDKLDNLVNFPIDGLDLEDRIGERKIAREMKLTAEEAKEFGMEGDKEESWVYDLYAVDNHFGGLGGGHYTAFCKNNEDKEWYNYDDSRVSKADEKSIQSRAAYLLFYRRRTVRPIGGISRAKAVEAFSRNPSRAASPAPSSPTLGPSTLRNTFNATASSSSPADSPLSSSPMSSDDDRLPSYSARGSFSPPIFSPQRSPSQSQSQNDSSVLDVDYNDETQSRNSYEYPTSTFVSQGQPYGGVNWGTTSSSRPGPVRHTFDMGTSQDTYGAPPSPPASDDGMNFENLRARTAAQFAGESVSADHPASEALAGSSAGMDTDAAVSEVDSLDVLMENARQKRAGAVTESGLGEEYGVITPEKAEVDKGMEVDGETEGGETASSTLVESSGTTDGVKE